MLKTFAVVACLALWVSAEDTCYGYIDPLTVSVSIDLFFCLGFLSAI